MNDYKTYTVTVRYQYPAWDEKDGISDDFQGNSKADAIKTARRQWDDYGITGTAVCKGKQWISAKLSVD